MLFSSSVQLHFKGYVTRFIISLISSIWNIFFLQSLLDVTGLLAKYNCTKKKKIIIIIKYTMETIEPFENWNSVDSSVTSRCYSKA